MVRVLLSTIAALPCIYLPSSFSPGRWFAARLLKLMIAYIVLHYDIKPLNHRPENISFGDASIPSFTIKIMVRRREKCSQMD